MKVSISPRGRKKNLGILCGGSSGRARTQFDDRHFAKNFAGAEARKNFFGFRAGRDFDQPIFDKINAVAGRAFVKNFLTGGEAAFLRDEA